MSSSFSPISITDYGTSPDTSSSTSSDVTLDAEYVVSELRKLQSSHDIKQYLSALLGSHEIYYRVYKCKNVDELIPLLAYDSIVIISNSIRLKECRDTNTTNILFDSINNKLKEVNKLILPYYVLVISCSLILLLSDNSDSTVWHPSLTSYLSYLSYPSYPLCDIPDNGCDMVYIRNKALDFIVNGSGYWGSHDWGLERAIKTPKESSIFLGVAAEKMTSMIAVGQLLINWKMSNLKGSTEALLQFAEASMKGSVVDLITATATSHGNNYSFTSMPTNTTLGHLMPSDASIQRLVPIDVSMPRVALNEAHVLMPNMSNDAPVLGPYMSMHPRGLMPNMPFNAAHFLKPNTLNDPRVFMHDMSFMPNIMYNNLESTFEMNRPELYYNMSRFRKEAKNAHGRFNALGASFAGIERFPSTMTSTGIMEEGDNIANVSNIDDSYVSIPTATYHASTSNRSRDDGKVGSSDGAFLDSDPMLASSSSKIVRRVKRKLEDKSADESDRHISKIPAKGIQITPVGTFRVQLNKAKNSTKKFTKNVSDIVDALWLFEIAVLVCDKPKELSSLLKSGNYQYLLSMNYIRDTDEYKSKLGNYILLLHEKKILKHDLTETAIAIFASLMANRCYSEEKVDPIDLHNLLSLKEDNEKLV